ncbi:MAG: hypothetical protein ACK5ZB_01990 [bacterium]
MAADREARVEMMRKFVANPDDLNDVFRALALLVRTGLLADNDKRLTEEIERFFGQKISEISLASITVAETQARAMPQVPPLPASLPPIPPPDPQSPPSISPTPGDLLAARVELLNDATPSTRTRTAQQIVTAIRDNAMAPADQLKVGRALVGLARNERMRGLSASGRYNLLYVLSEVPQALWQTEQWRSLAEDLGASLVTLERRIAENTVRVGDDTRRVLDKLKAQLR